MDPEPPKPERIGDWLMTSTGRQFYPLDPRPDEVRLEDIARALSQQCRFGGHTAMFYSVAQHAVMVSELVERIAPHLALMALHHDSAEAYLVDVPRPVKHLFEGYEAAEQRILDVIHEALGVFAPEWGRPLIKYADDAALRLEAQQLMPPFPEGSWINTIRAPEHAWPGVWIPDIARDTFIYRHNMLLEQQQKHTINPGATRA